MASLFNPSELYALLAQYGGLPQWAKDYPIGGERGQYLTAENRIIAPPPEQKGMVPNAQARSTLAHEMSHAVQFQLFFDAAHNIQQKIKNNKKVSDEEKRFLDSAQKMYLETFGTVGQIKPKETQKRRDNLDLTIKALYPPTGKDGKMSQYDYYRTSPVELQAFGIGSMTEGGKQKGPYDRQPLHLDPSFATEFSILAEQFGRLPEDVKVRNPKREQSLQAERAATDRQQLYKFEDITADPFKPTLK